MRSLVGVAVAVSVLGLVPACGDDDSGDPTQFVSLDQFDASYKDAECTYLVRCGFFADKTTCLAATLQVNASYSISAALRAEILAGRVGYDGNHVKSCFDAIANATCDKTDELGRVTPAECFDFTHGTVAGGGTCTSDPECISGFCNSSSSSSCSGTCVGDTAPMRVPAGLDQNCSSLVGCISGLYCDRTSFRCATLKASGEVCVDNSECAYGLGCAGMTSGGRTCKALPTLDQPCPDGVCRDDGLHCVTTTTSATACKAYGLAGATCTSSTDCSPYFPCDFSTPSTCKKPPSIGEACTSSNSRCFDEHSYCDGTTLKCVAAKPDGAMCTSLVQCISGDCDSTTMTCVTPTSSNCP